ncbi:MAG: GtrA family protein [Nocardioides sp.]|nr:GtrA family protein [Nocardioidaceae bacterium]MCB8956414.1 GtrA family protein [Nocardioides sp.]
MSNRWRRVLTEAYRFLAVGGLATIVAFLIFNFLVHGFATGYDAPLSGQPYLAYAIANVVGMVVSYRGSRSWVFKDRPPRTADGGRLMFVAINLVTMLIPMACLWVSRNVMGLDDPFSDNLSANLIGLFLGMVARFYLFRTLVFRRPVHLAELKQRPMQVFELSELRQDTGPILLPVDRVEVTPVGEGTTGPSTSGPARRPGPGPAAG